MQHHAPPSPSWTHLLWVSSLAVVALAAAFFVAVLVPRSAHAQQPGQRPDFKVTVATFDGRNLHVEYINATGIGYPKRRYEVGFQWHDNQGKPVGVRHWLPVPEVDRGGVSILDNRFRIELSYRSEKSTYGRYLSRFIDERPSVATELRVTVDDGDRIAEENEQNNTATFKVPLPDLAVSEATWTKGIFLMSYRNGGDAAATSPSLWLHWADGTGKQIGRLAWLDTKTIAPGASASVWPVGVTLGMSDGPVAFRKFLASPPDTATHVKVILDGPNRIGETNEENNTVLLENPEPPLPDLTVSDLKLGDQAITWKEKNLGDTVDGNFSYITNIVWLDASGKKLSDWEPQTGMVRIPAGWVGLGELSTRLGITAAFLTPPAGAVKLRVTVDSKGTLAEKNEDNNVMEIAVPLPDLTVSDLALAGDKITWKEKNLGDTVSGSFTYLTQIAWLDVSGKILSERGPQTATATILAGSVTLEEMSTRFGAPASFLTPPAGAVKLRATIDPKGTVVEKDDGNNSVEATVPLPAEPLKSDLVVAALTLDPAQPKLGDAVKVTARVENHGKVPVGEMSVVGLDVDLGNDRSIDEQKARAVIKDVVPGTSQTYQWNDVRDAAYHWKATEGTHRIIACADVLGSVKESDERNNCAERIVTVGGGEPVKSEKPDLTITDATLDTAALRFWMHNRGATATASAVSLWYELVDAQGKRVSELRWINVDAMHAKSKQQGNQLLDFATLDSERGKMTLGEFVGSAPPSVTHLKLTIDGPNTHAEANEQNNSVLLPRPAVQKPAVSEQPDLVLRDATLADGKFRATIMNVGKAIATRIMWQFAWMGKDGSALVTSDVEAAVGTLAPGASYPVELPIVNARAFGIFRFLQDMPDAAAALAVTVDPKHAIAESDETNNVARIEIVGPDLTLGVVETRDGALAIDVKNIGTQPSVATDIWLAWFGNSGSLPSSGAVDLPAIAAGAVMTVSVPIGGGTEASKILSDPPKNGIRLRVFLDGSRRVEERSEKNNDRMIDREKLSKPTAPTVVKLPDLVVRDLVITPEQPQRNTLVTFTVRVENVGGAGVGKSSATWLNLIRPRGGAMTLPLEKPTTPDLAPGASAAVRWDGEKFWTVQDGEHLVIICADAMGYVHESDEENNCVRKKFIVTVPMPAKPAQPDLVVQNVAFTPTNPEAGDVLTVTAVVHNAGTARAGASVVWFTPNADSDDDEASAIPTPQDVPALAPGVSATVTWEEAWAAETGTEAFEVCADVEETVKESNEGNNCRTAKLTVSDVSFLRRAVGFPLRVVFDVFSTPIRAGTEE